MVRSNEAQRIGSIIRRLRKLSGMTQMALAEKMGVTYQQVQKYEKGTCELTIRRLRQVSDALNVPMSTFISDMSSVSEPEASYLSEDETEVLALFRRLKRKKLRQGFIEMLRDIVSVSEDEE